MGPHPTPPTVIQAGKLSSLAKLQVDHEWDPILVTLPFCPPCMQFDFFNLEVILAAMNKR